MTERKCFIFSFADVEVREREFLLIKGEKRLSVEPKAFRVLVFLLRNPGRLVSKDEIVASVWNDSAVSDNSLTRSIAQLRRVLDDDPREPRYILTVPTLGYRLLCEVSARDDGFGSSFAAGSPPGKEESGETRHALDDTRYPQRATPPDYPSREMEDEKGGTLLRQKQRSRKLLLVGIAGAVLLLLVAGLILRRFSGAGAVSTLGQQHLAVEQRLTANPTDVPVRDAVISPDGKYVAYADPTGLYLRQISSGETRRLNLPKDFVMWPASWFPDDTHLLAVRIAGQPQVFSLWKPSLYKLSILGGDPQMMMNDVAAGYVSPDGSRIAYLPVPNTNEMWIMDSDGANPRKVVSDGEPINSLVNPTWIHPIAWSPSGQHLAYIENHGVAGPEPVEPTHTLRITDPSGAFQAVVLDDPRIGEALWWTPDGRFLFPFREDPASRLPNYGLNSIRVNERTGKAEGPPQPITQAEGSISAMSGTADGKRLVLSRSNAPPQSFIATYDAGAHQWKEPRRLTLDANANLAEAWTADSKAAFFVSNRNGAWKLFKQAIDQTIPEVLAEGRSLSLPRLSADGSHVLYLSSTNPDDVSFPASLMSKPLAGGTPRMVIQGKGIMNHQCAMAPSTLCIFSQLDGQNFIFRTFDLEHGAGRELLRTVGFVNWSFSSDGSKLALFLDQHRIRFVSINTGAAHDVTVKGWPLSNGDWAANSRTVFMPSDTPAGVPVILEVDQSGKATVALQGRANNEFGWMVQSPDGRYALLSEYIPSGNNAWIVNDF